MILLHLKFIKLLQVLSVLSTMGGNSFHLFQGRYFTFRLFIVDVASSNSICLVCKSDRMWSNSMLALLTNCKWKAVKRYYRKQLWKWCINCLNEELGFEQFSKFEEISSLLLLSLNFRYKYSRNYLFFLNQPKLVPTKKIIHSIPLILIQNLPDFFV